MYFENVFNDLWPFLYDDYEKRKFLINDDFKYDKVWRIKDNFL